LSASVVYGGEVLWTLNLGFKNKSQPKVKPDENTIYRIGSVTKLFPTIMMFQMYDQGFIESLDDPISDMFPDFTLVNPYATDQQGITWRQVASQNSGLPREAPCTPTLCNESTKEILSRLQNISLISPPWTMPSYSNLGYALLGRLLEDTVLQTFEEYTLQKIASPVGMVNTGFNYTAEVVRQMAISYAPDGSTIPLYNFGWWGPAGQAYSTTADLSNLMISLMKSEVPESTGLFERTDIAKEMMLPSKYSIST
jgi:CubicO group peptidase (beta-lactamase class C family)